MAAPFDPKLTRRAFLGTSAAALGAGALHAAPAPSPRFRRFEITDPAMPPRVLESYAKGITEMLRRPPSDPLNWYRNAFLHVFDCPHGNWWFLVWHRAYIGWFERKIRELSGDPEFALPYWDWTKSPRIPAVMFKGVLDPNNSAYVGNFDAFKRQYAPAVNTMFASFSPAQKGVLVARGLNNAAAFWDSIKPGPDGMFFDQPDARGMSAADPNFDETTTQSVGTATLNSALRASIFAGTQNGNGSPGFCSAMAVRHSDESRKGVLESQPHDNIHGALGGENSTAFMTSFLSSIDPIFYLHHANLDRLWDVWTRRQTLRRRLALPTGAALATWSREQFLFFTDEKGRPVAKNKAGDYITMASFDYEYTRGSGEDQVPIVAPLISLAPPPPVGFAVRSAQASADDDAGGSAVVPAVMLRTRTSESLSPVAEVKLNLTHSDRGRRFRVSMAAAGGEHVEAGGITVFNHHLHGPASFAVPVPENLKIGTDSSAPLDIKVTPLEFPDRPLLPGAPAPGPVTGRRGAPTAKRGLPRVGTAAPGPAVQVDAISLKMN